MRKKVGGSGSSWVDGLGVRGGGGGGLVGGEGWLVVRLGVGGGVGYGGCEPRIEGKQRAELTRPS